LIGPLEIGSIPESHFSNFFYIHIVLQFGFPVIFCLQIIINDIKTYTAFSPLCRGAEFNRNYNKADA
jgi:hypothetical protein